MATKKETTKIPEKALEKVKPASEVIKQAPKTVKQYKVNTELLNVRSAPGYDAPIQGTVSMGDTLDVSSVKSIGGNKWGQIENGFVCLEFCAHV